MVVIGGLGSVPGAFIAAVLVSELNAFGILVFPTISLVLVFLVMACVLVVRPWGLLGKPEAAARPTIGIAIRPWRPFAPRRAHRPAGRARGRGAAADGGRRLCPGGGVRDRDLRPVRRQPAVPDDAPAASPPSAMPPISASAPMARPSRSRRWACRWRRRCWPAPLFGLLGAALFGAFCVRLSGVYFAMLTLAFAQIAWSVATNGSRSPAATTACWGSGRRPGRRTRPASTGWRWRVAAAGIALLRVLTFSPFGFALRGVRDSTQRAEAIGIGRRQGAMGRLPGRRHHGRAGRRRCSPSSRAASSRTISASRCRSTGW